MTAITAPRAPHAVASDEPRAEPTMQARYFKTCRTGGILAGLLFVPILALNSVNFLATGSTDNFYAAQARSWLHFRWDVPQSVLQIEGFRHAGHWYMYYGPFPALLRLPLIPLGHNLDNRATQLSMLLAFVVALVGTARLAWSVRAVVRPDAPLTRAERVATAGFVTVVGGGSALLFLASKAWIFHEAEIWGAALAIAAFAAILDVVRDPSPRNLRIASALAAGSVLSRVSVGLGPIAALALLAACSVFRPTRPLAGLAGDVDRRTSRRLGLAAVVPAFLYSAVNYAKFGSLFVFPTGAQLMSQINPQRRYFLAHSGGSYFGLKFVPTTLWHYATPFGLRFRGLVPWIDFPNPGRVFGHVVFDAIEPTASVPATMPLLTVLAAAGLIVLVRRRTRSRTAALRAPAIGALVGGLGVLPFGYIAPRYLSDFMPFLVLGAVIGFQYLIVLSARLWVRRRQLVVGLWSVTACLAAWSIIANVALAVDYHYTTNWITEDIVAPYIRAQYSFNRSLGRSAPYVEHGTALPYPPRPRGTLYVVGDCSAVYWSPGPIPSLSWNPWVNVGRTRAAGEYRLRLRVDDQRRATIEPIVVRGDPGHVQTIALWVRRGTMRFFFSSEGHEGLPHSYEALKTFFTGTPIPFSPRRTYDVTAVMDPNSGAVHVELDGQVVLRFRQVQLTPRQLHTYVFPTPHVEIGRNDVGSPHATSRFAGRIELLPSRRPSICHDIGE